MLESQKKRIDYLDSVRGIAAVLVLFYHVICSHWDWTLKGNLSKIIFNGTGAVAMFFVLSGLVLSLKLIRQNTEITSKFMSVFVVKRIFRLYPAFLFTLIFYVYLQYDTTDIFQIFEEGLLIRGKHVLLVPDWTLGVEMALSLFVPFMVIIIRKSEALFIWFILMTLFIGSSFVSEFILLFGLGILIAKRFDQIQNFNTKDHWLLRYKYYFIPVLLFLFSFRHITALVPIPSPLKYLMMNIIGLSEYTFSGFGSFLILLFIINTKSIQNFLSNGFLVFIGKVSYGIYLSHWFFTKLVMTNFDYVYETFALGNKFLFLIVYVLFTLVSSILAGWFIYKFIEVPFIGYAKKLTDRMKMKGV